MAEFLKKRDKAVMTTISRRYSPEMAAAVGNLDMLEGWFGIDKKRRLDEQDVYDLQRIVRACFRLDRREFFEKCAEIFPLVPDVLRMFFCPMTVEDYEEDYDEDFTTPPPESAKHPNWFINGKDRIFDWCDFILNKLRLNASLSVNDGLVRKYFEDFPETCLNAFVAAEDEQMIAVWMESTFRSDRSVSLCLLHETWQVGFI